MDNFLNLEFRANANVLGGGQATPSFSLIGLLGGAAAPAPMASPYGGLGVSSASYQLMMLQSLLSTFQALSGIWGGVAGGSAGPSTGFGGFGGQVQGLGGQAQGFAGFGGQAQGFGGFGGQVQGFGGISLPPLGGAPRQGLGLPPLPGVSTPAVGGQRDAAPIDTAIDYKALSAQQRNQLSGMNEEQRAALHLWGIQMGSAGKQDGGVLLNVLNHPEQFKPAEVALAKRLAAEDKAQYGGITGKSLDRAFFGLYEQITGKDVSQRYASSPVHFASGEVDLSNRQSGKNGLSKYENEVLQLWGHNPLFTGGKIDGSIVEYALNSKNTLEANLDKGDLRTLLDADKAADGVVNGGSLENTFIDALDHVYNGGPAATQQRTMDEALAEASKRRAGLLPPVDPRRVSSARSVDVFAQMFAGGDPSRCPFLNTGGAASGSYAVAR